MMKKSSNDKIQMSNKIQNPNVLKKEVNSDQKENRMNYHESTKSEKHEIFIGFKFELVLLSCFRNFVLSW